MATTITLLFGVVFGWLLNSAYRVATDWLVGLLAELKTLSTLAARVKTIESVLVKAQQRAKTRKAA